MRANVLKGAINIGIESELLLQLSCCTNIILWRGVVWKELKSIISSVSLVFGNLKERSCWGSHGKW